MKCSCCGKKKGLFESFEELEKDVNICVECSKKLYKYQDFKKEKNNEEAVKMLKQIKPKKNTEEFSKWLEAFLQRFEEKKTVDTSINSTETIQPNKED